MPDDRKQLNRVSIRLKGFDYSSAASYFITICTQNRQCLFGEIESGVTILNPAGQMIIDEWLAIQSRFTSVQLEEFVVMPNHFHAILSILPTVEGSLVSIVNGRVPTRGTPTLGEMIGAFKSITTNQYISGVKHQKWTPFDRKLWQRNYYEHIIRDDRSFKILQSYIQDNPLRWEIDQLHPDVPSKW
jgi:putative transposase